MAFTTSFVSAFRRLAPKWRVCLAAVLIVVATLASTFIVVVFWELAGRLTSVRSGNGQVELNFNPRIIQAKAVANGPRP